jgi:hypothetical protein
VQGTPTHLLVLELKCSQSKRASSLKSRNKDIKDFNFRFILWKTESGIWNQQDWIIYEYDNQLLDFQH